MFSLVSGDWLTLIRVMVGILSVDLLTLDSMQQLPCFIHDGISFLVTVKQVGNISIWIEASLDGRLGDEFAFIT